MNNMENSSMSMFGLYRGKDLEGNWVYGGITSPSHEKDGKIYIVTIKSNDHEDVNTFVAVDPKTVCVRIGIVDKNGEYIFSGDIVRVRICEVDKIGRFRCESLLPDYIVGQVTYDPVFCKFQISFCKNKAGLLACEFGWYMEELEVVGNVFDHPELLKDEV